jgi:hypothetical protein
MLDGNYHPFVRGKYIDIRQVALWQVRGKVLGDKLPIPLMAAGFLDRVALVD